MHIVFSLLDKQLKIYIYIGICNQLSLILTCTSSLALSYAVILSLLSSRHGNSRILKFTRFSEFRLFLRTCLSLTSTVSAYFAEILLRLTTKLIWRLELTKVILHYYIFFSVEKKSIFLIPLCYSSKNSID